MLKVQLTQTQILELIILGIKDGNYKEVKDFAQDVIKEINKEKDNQDHEYLRSLFTNVINNKIKKEDDKQDHNEKNIKKFEIDKYYKHKSGKIIHILSAIETTFYGYCLVAETSSGELEPIGEHEDATVGWIEIDENEWIENFS